MTHCAVAAAIGQPALGVTGKYERWGSVPASEMLGESWRVDRCGWEVRCSGVLRVARLQTRRRPLAATSRWIELVVSAKRRRETREMDAV